ncbi:MAG: glutathione S-transferase family protein [Alphaproteobacteria bacterium]|nr:glutathione S-transferase family protein [Alphaproteobacteria bacterium]
MAVAVYGFGPAFGLPDVSPFAVKAMLLLAMAGLSFERRQGDPRRAPKGKLPFIDDDGTTVADTTFIRFHIEDKYRIDLDRGLSQPERATAWAFERMLEEQFYFALVHSRRMDDASFDRGPRRVFEAVPAPLRPLVARLVRRKIRQQLEAQGMGRHTPPQIIALARRALDALSAQLGAKPFLMGEQPCGADAGIAAQLISAACPYFDNELTALARSYPNLLAYSDRMAAKYLPL